MRLNGKENRPLPSLTDSILTRTGAKRVYAVEVSDIDEMAKLLIKKNGLSGIIKIVKGKVEDVELPEKVDVIVSEPIGFLLVHERMLESYIAARERFVKPEILAAAAAANSASSSTMLQFMYPTMGTIKMLPFTDFQLVQEIAAKSQFWHTKDFYGVDMSCLEKHATAQYFSQPVIGYFDPSILIASEEDTATHSIDFRTARAKEDLEEIEIPFRFKITKTALMHGLACWFDADFLGTRNHVVLSTSPKQPGTHWYQVRLLLARPLAVNIGQVVTGSMNMKVNTKASYDIFLLAKIENTKELIESTNHIALHDPYYHYLSSPGFGSGFSDAGGGGVVESFEDLAADFKDDEEEDVAVVNSDVTKVEESLEERRNRKEFVGPALHEHNGSCSMNDVV